ncbi:septum formation initiator family protein [Lactococcus nasutitermitis]|uniref:Septum formation initiator family protein n=1 Tax=Lactococcus nasutitermitis TaxID=1652957 RepID=A0ABV9JB44_9LACT|nr:septum formation initiator family protein [Lactococcus nasutitermitis]
MTKQVIRLENDFTNEKLRQKTEQQAPKRRHLGLILVVAMILFSLASISLVRSYQNLQKQLVLEQKTIKQHDSMTQKVTSQSQEIQKLQDPNFLQKYARTTDDYSQSGEKIFTTPSSKGTGANP